MTIRGRATLTLADYERHLRPVLFPELVAEDAMLTDAQVAVAAGNPRLGRILDRLRDEPDSMTISPCLQGTAKTR